MITDLSTQIARQVVRCRLQDPVRLEEVRAAARDLDIEFHQERTSENATAKAQVWLSVAFTLWDHWLLKNQQDDYLWCP
jgi:hypothetical protein